MALIDRIEAFIYEALGFQSPANIWEDVSDKFAGIDRDIPEEVEEAWDEATEAFYTTRRRLQKERKAWERLSKSVDQKLETALEKFEARWDKFTEEHRG